MRVENLTIDGPRLLVDWADGGRSAFHALWLRDNCPCPDCRHPSGQRLLDTAAIPPDVRLDSARVDDGAVETVWPGGHVSRFDADWLRERPAFRGRRRLWRAGVELPAARHADVVARPEGLHDWLAAADELGFAILHDVPVVEGEVTRVAELFGYVRQTNYGRYFDVRSVVEPNNLAYTGLALGAHTDNPYREPPPTLQLLHCLSSSAGGGDTTLVDGFAVAEELRARQPERFELLARHPLRFRFADEDTELEAEAPVISLDARGEVCAIRFNTRSAAPLELDAELVEPYYDAYLAFARMLADPELEIRFKLEPGDLFIVDNTRVLHGRTGFSDAGLRHLQGCYADLDGLRSRLAVLCR